MLRVSQSKAQLLVWVLASQVRSSHLGLSPQVLWQCQLPNMHALRVGSTLPVVRSKGIPSPSEGAGSLAVVGGKKYGQFSQSNERWDCLHIAL